MAHTVEQVLFDVEVWLKRMEVTSTIGRPELKLLLYEAARDVYEKAVLSNPAFYTKMTAFATGTSFALPSNFRAVVLIEVTTAGCTSGAARLLDDGQWDTIAESSRIGAVLTDPIARIDASTIVLSPACAGNFFYIHTISEDDFPDETVDLETLFPKIFVQSVIIKMQELARKRHYNIPSVPGEVQKQLEVAKNTMKRLEKSMKTLEITEEMSETPA